WGSPLIVAPWLSPIVTLAFDTTIVVCWTRLVSRDWRDLTRRQCNAEVGFTIVAWALLTPMLQAHHYSLLFTALGFAVVAAWRAEMGPRLQYVALVCSAFFMVPALFPLPLLADGPNAIRILVSGVWTYGLLGLAVLAAWLTLFSRRADPAQITVQRADLPSVA